MPLVDRTLAIIISQESPHLAATYAAVVDQTTPAAHIMVATPPATVLPEILADAQVVPYTGTFSHGVQAALTHYLEQGGVPPQWLWLLHDDSIPDAAALEHLERAVHQARAVGVAGTKQVVGSRPDELISVGTSYTRFGARYTGVEPGDLDQGQLDGRDDIYAVGTAGMLIRTEIWQEIGGADPATSPWLDGLDISRKTHLLGHRVIVVPQAVVRHHRQSLHNGNSYPARRRALMFHQWATVPLGLLPLAMLATIIGGVLRAGWRIATKQFPESWADLTAPWRVLAQPIALAKARRKYARAKKVPRSQLGELLTPVATVQAMRRDHRRTLAESRKVVAAPSELELREKASLARRRRLSLGAVLTIPILMSLVAIMPTIMRGPVLAASLPGADSTWWQLGQQVASGWMATGDGFPGPAHPLVTVLFLLNTLMGGFWGTPLWVTVAVILGIAPLMGTWGAWVAAGAATRSLGLRALLALAWGTGPALWLFLASGSLAEVIIYGALPWWGYALVRTLGCDLRDVITSGLATDESPIRAARSGSTSMAAAASGGLLLALMGMSIPALALIAGIASLIALRISRPVRSPGAVKRVWFMQFPFGLAILPLLSSMVTSPTARSWWSLIDSPTAPQWNLSGEAALPWQVWIPVASLGGIAITTIMRAHLRGRIVTLGWGIAAVGIAIFLAPQLLTQLFPHQVSGMGIPAGGVIAMGGILTWAGWCAAIAAGYGGIAAGLQKRSFGLRHIGVGITAVVAIIAITGSAVLWPMVFHTARTGGSPSSNQVTALAEQITVPVAEHYVTLQPRITDPLSALGRQIQSDEAQGKVLAIQQTPQGVVAQIWRGAGPQIAEIPARTPIRLAEDQSTIQLRQIIANLASGGAENMDAPLAQHGIQLVVVPAADSQILPTEDHLRAELLSQVEGTEGVDFVTDHPSGAVYRVNPRTPNARALVTANGSETTYVLSWTEQGITEKAQAKVDLPQGGTLVLSERRSTGWKATLDGKPLRSISEDWRQTFEIPAGSHGNLEVSFEAPLQRIWLIVGGLTLLLYGLVSVPVVRRSVNEEL